VFRSVLIAAILLLLPATLPLDHAHELIQRHCQVWHGASDQVASCRIAWASRLRAYKSGLRPADWLFQKRERARSAPVRGQTALS